MKKISLLLFTAAAAVNTYAQSADAKDASLKAAIKSEFTVLNNMAATPVKNQAATGTCWCFSTTSLVESECIKNHLGDFDLSEMFTVRNIYIEKAKNYVLRQGHAQFGEGALGHDEIRAVTTYGAMPESVYSGLKPGQTFHNHQKLFRSLKQYLDSIINKIPLQENWLDGYIAILDETLGKPPASFDYDGRQYTAKSFAHDVLKFNPDDYVYITSFLHHPFYEPFILEVPDNFSNGAYYNIPLNEMIQLAKDVLMAGYTISWDADVSNKGFMQKKGIAVLNDTSINAMRKETVTGAGRPPVADNHQQFAEDEVPWDAAFRQTLFENLTTQDDHLMHITGIEKSKDGKTFFIVKNSWGKVGPVEGYINVSEGYFAINTISLVVPKAAISSSLLEKLKIK